MTIAVASTPFAYQSHGIVMSEWKRECHSTIFFSASISDLVVFNFP